MVRIKTFETGYDEETRDERDSGVKLWEEETEFSAFLGAQPRAGPPRDVSTSHGGISTTFQSCQSLAMGPNKAVSVIWRMSV